MDGYCDWGHMPSMIYPNSTHSLSCNGVGVQKQIKVDSCFAYKTFLAIKSWNITNISIFLVAGVCPLKNIVIFIIFIKKSIIWN